MGSVAVAVFCLPSPALADTSPPPPENLEATYDPETDTVHLTWDAPGEGDYTYRVYRGDQFLETVSELEYTDDSPSYVSRAYKVYTVENGVQSSQPALTVAGCPPATVGQNPPFVHPHPECIQW